MLSIKYDSDTFYVGGKVGYDRYIHFKWDTGYMDIPESVWNKLPKKKKSLILDLGKGE